MQYYTVGEGDHPTNIRVFINDESTPSVQYWNKLLGQWVQCTNNDKPIVHGNSPEQVLSSSTGTPRNKRSVLSINDDNDNERNNKIRKLEESLTGEASSSQVSMMPLLMFHHLPMELIVYILEFGQYMNLAEINSLEAIFFKKKGSLLCRHPDVNDDEDEDENNEYQGIHMDQVGVLYPNISIDRNCSQYGVLLLIAPWIRRLKLASTYMRMSSSQKKRFVHLLQRNLQSVEMVNDEITLLGYRSSSLVVQAYPHCIQSYDTATIYKTHAKNKYQKLMDEMSRYPFIRTLTISFYSNDPCATLMQEVKQRLTHLKYLSITFYRSVNSTDDSSPDQVNESIEFIISQMTQLRSLTINVEYSMLSTLKLDALIGNKNLYSLSLWGQMDENIHSSVMECINQSKVKYLSCCIESDDCFQVLADNANLEKIKIKTQNVRALDHILPMKSVTHLVIHPMDWPGESWQTFKSTVAQQTKLNQISLDPEDDNVRLSEEIASVLRSFLPKEINVRVMNDHQPTHSTTSDYDSDDF